MNLRVELWRRLADALVVLAALTGPAYPAAGSAADAGPAHAGAQPQGGIMKIRMATEGGDVITATLADTAAARDFAALLPLDLLLADYASTEKISDLPRRLETSGAPPGFTPSAGDIAYYAPWGNQAVFHKDFGYSAGLIRLGKIDAGVALLRRPGTLRVMIERLK